MVDSYNVTQQELALLFLGLRPLKWVGVPCGVPSKPQIRGYEWYESPRPCKNWVMTSSSSFFWGGNDQPCFKGHGDRNFALLRYPFVLPIEKSQRPNSSPGFESEETSPPLEKKFCVCPREERISRSLSPCWQKSDLIPVSRESLGWVSKKRRAPKKE